MIRIPKPDDFHVHLRQGPALRAYARDHAAVFGRGLVMPNTTPPIRTADELIAYRDKILQAAKKSSTEYQPLMTFKVGSAAFMGIDPAEVPHALAALKAAGAIAGKLYPAGVTTNSADGVTDLDELYQLFSAMQDQELVLCVHGEDPDAFCLDRESAYLPRLNRIVCDFPRLKIVLEHVSTAAAVEWVQGQPDRIGATVTVHHLLHTLDDMLSGHLRPHLFCKPLIKRPEDRAAIQAAVLSGSPRFFFGSDSAPHTKMAKECDCGAAGVYSAPVALPLLAAFFETNQKLDLLAGFVSRHGAKFYDLPLSEKELVLVRRPWTVPTLMHAATGARAGSGSTTESGVVPHEAGSKLLWSIEGLTFGPQGPIFLKSKS